MALQDTMTARNLTREELLAGARRAGPTLRRNAAQEETDGRLSDETVEALHESGVFGMLVPRALGGSEVDPITAIEVLQQLSYDNSSAGWVALAASLEAGMCGAFLGDEAVATMFGGDRFPVVAGQGGFSRPDTATKVEGGYRLSGDYSFGSGIQHAQWVYTQGIDDQSGAMRIHVAPVSDVELKPTSWDVLGLRATGSLDYSVRDVFVSDAFTHGLLVEDPLRGGPLYTVGLTGLVMIVHEGWALGVARRMLDDLRDIVHEKIGRAGSLAESPRFHEKFGFMEAKYAAARAYVYTTWQGIAETLAAGRRIDMVEKSHMRMALYQVTRMAAEIAEEVFFLAGTKPIWSSDLQRYFRDIHTGNQHGTSGPAVPEGVGRVLAGLAPGHDWAYLSVIPEEMMPPA